MIYGLIEYICEYTASHFFPGGLGKFGEGLTSGFLTQESTRK
jgi:hypothetical protein